MIKEEVIIQKIQIRQNGEQVYFQVILPADVVRITGIEYDAILEVRPVSFAFASTPTPLKIELRVRLNKVIGRLTLWSGGCENIFLQQDIKENRNIDFGEFASWEIYIPPLLQQASKRDELSVSVEGNLIEGYYKDSWGLDEFPLLEYRLFVYIWIEKFVK